MFGCCSTRSSKPPSAAGGSSMPPAPSASSGLSKGVPLTADLGEGRLGISFLLDESTHEFVVKSVAPGGPADLSGMCIPGDILVEIDGARCKDMDDLYRKVCGPVGSKVNIALRGSRGEKRFTLVRRKLSPATMPGATTASSTSPPSSTSTITAATSSSMPMLSPPSSLSLNNGERPKSTSELLVPNGSGAYKSNNSTNSISNIVSQPIPSSTTSTSLGRYSASDIVGVGINFMHSPEGRMCVRSLLPGGPAAITGGIFKDDILVEVDGVNVEQTPVDKIAQYVLGPRGSTVTLGFQDPQGILKRITVRRDWALQDNKQ